MDEIIIITAGKKSKWVKERFTPGGIARWLGEGIFGDYKEKMNLLREVDDRIQAWVDDIETIEDKLDQAFKADRILQIGLLLRQLDIRLKKIVSEGGKVKKVVEESLVRHESQLGSVHLPSDLGVEVMKEAGIWDNLKRKWLSNRLEDHDGRKERKLALQTLIKEIHLMAETLRTVLKDMETARVKGKIGGWINGLKKIEDQQKYFVSKYTGLRDTYLKHYVDAYDKDQARQTEEAKKQEVKPDNSQWLEENKKALETSENPKAVETSETPEVPIKPKTLEELLKEPRRHKSRLGTPPNNFPGDPDATPATMRDPLIHKQRLPRLDVIDYVPPTANERLSNVLPQSPLGKSVSPQEMKAREMLKEIENAQGDLTVEDVTKPDKIWSPSIINLQEDPYYQQEKDQEAFSDTQIPVEMSEPMPKKLELVNTLHSASSDEEFLQSLITKFASNRHTPEIAQEILRYSATIEDSDPDTADLLIQIVENAL